MVKYIFELTMAIVQEYLAGKGKLGYLAKKHGVRSKKTGTRMDQCLSEIWRGRALAQVKKAKLFFSIQDRCDRVISNE